MMGPAHCTKANVDCHLPRALAAIFCLAIYSEAFPYGIPLFFPLALVLFGYFGLVRKRFLLPLNGGVVFFVGSLLFYCIGLLKTGVAYDENRRDLQNAFGLILIIPLLFSLTAREFTKFRDATQSVNSSVSALIAVVGIYKFNLITLGVNVPLFWVEGRPYPWGTSLVTDYNFFAYAMLVGALSSLFCCWRVNSVARKLYYLLTFLLSIISMTFAGSRRGWVTEAVLFAALACFLLWTAMLFIVKLRANAAISNQQLRNAVAFMIVVGFIAVFALRYGHVTTNPNRGIDDQLDDLRNRFLTLTDPDAAFKDRSERWEYSLALLQGSSAADLIFGNGFDYLQTFASEFQTHTKEDYPHNPIISAALYSGLLGAAWVSLALLCAGFEFLLRRKDDAYFGLLYLACVCFVLPSFNSILSGKFLMFLLVIPWLLRSMRQCENHYDSGYSRPKQLYA